MIDSNVGRYGTPSSVIRLSVKHISPSDGDTLIRRIDLPLRLLLVHCVNKECTYAQCRSFIDHSSHAVITVRLNSTTKETTVGNITLWLDIPNNRNYIALRFHTLGISQLARFERSKELPDLDAAISSQLKAIQYSNIRNPN